MAHNLADAVRQTPQGGTQKFTGPTTLGIEASKQTAGHPNPAGLFSLHEPGAPNRQPVSPSNLDEDLVKKRKVVELMMRVQMRRQTSENLPEKFRLSKVLSV
jgi:hypothetical protein